jgi:glycosyltransferase involved in cell wall biosynthesis
MKRPIGQVGVVVPAHDEEVAVGHCLEAVCRAAQTVSLPVTVVVVLDDCGDRTERICQSFPVNMLRVKARSVGFARHAGISSLLRAGGDAASIWISNTDADTVVPVWWLRAQLDLAASGADVVVGTVRLPEGADHVARQFRSAYARGIKGVDHSHVHGANVGFRASAYLDVGGFPPLALHEDRLLLRRLEASGAAVVRSSSLPVQTSGRLVGRCEGGFATGLRKLASVS